MTGFIVSLPDPWQHAYCGGSAPYIPPKLVVGVVVSTVPFTRASFLDTLHCVVQAYWPNPDPNAYLFIGGNAPFKPPQKAAFFGVPVNPPPRYVQNRNVQMWDEWFFPPPPPPTIRWPRAPPQIAYDPAAAALFAAMSVQPDDTRKGLYNDIIVSLKALGLWTRIDVLYLRAVETAQQASLNWKSPGTFTTTDVGTPAFIPDQGTTGVDSTSYLTTGFVPSTNAVQYTLNDRSAFAWSLTNTRVNGEFLFIDQGGTSGRCANDPWQLSFDRSSATLNTAAGGTSVTSPGGASGLFTWTGTSSTTFDCWRNTTLFGSPSQTTAALPTVAMTFGGCSRTTALFGMGASLSAQNIADLHDTFFTYLVAVGAIVDNPPFVQPSLLNALHTSLGAWAAADPLPQTGPKLPQPAAAVVARPPFVPLDTLQVILGAWIAPDILPILPELLPPAISAVPADNPPFTLASALDALHCVLTAWLPPDPAPTLREQSPPSSIAVPASNPPFGMPPAWQTVVLAAWVPPPAQAPANQNLNPVFEAIRVDQPPSSMDDALDLYSILNAWLPPDPAPITGPKLNQGLLVDAPPRSAAALADLYSVLSAWLPPDPAPILSDLLPPALAAVTVSVPPPYSTSDIYAVLAAWIPPPPQPVLNQQLNPAFAAVAANNPPFAGTARATQQTIYTTWAPQDPAIQPQRFAPIVAPAAAFVPAPSQHLAEIAAWQLPVPMPALPEQAPPSIIAVRADAPPPAAHRIDTELVAWLPPDPRPYFPAYQVQPFFTPQIVTPRQQAQISTVLISWLPPDPAPIAARNNYPSLLAVAVSSPPPSSTAALNAILAAWIPPPPAPIVNGNLSQAAETVAANNPPFGVPAAGPRDAILAAWVPPPAQAPVNGRLAPDLVAHPAQYPPPLTRLHPAILPAWQAPDPPLQARRTVPMPPPVARSDAGLYTVLVAWRPDDTPPMPRGLVAPLVAAPPTPATPAWISTVLGAWQADAWPQQRRAQITTGARTDNPPFGMPQAWLTGVIAAWVPPPPAPVIRPLRKISVDQLLLASLHDVLYYPARPGLYYPSAGPALGYASGPQNLFYP